MLLISVAKKCVAIVFPHILHAFSLVEKFTYRITLHFIHDIVMASGEQERKNGMASDVVHPVSVSRSPAAVANTQNLTKLGLVRKRELPQVESSVVVFRHQTDHRRRVLLLFTFFRLLIKKAIYKSIW